MPATDRTIVSSSPTFGRYSHQPLDLLRSAGFEVQMVERDNAAALLDALALADAWITGFEPVDATTLEHARNIKIVAKCGAGMDNFDMAYLAGRGIATVNVPGGNATAVAEYTMGQILALSRGLLVNDRAVRDGRWRPNIGCGLDGRTIGIIGFGAIGREVARLALAFGMHVLVADPAVDDQIVASGSARLVDLEELLRHSDVVSIHVPLMESTRKLLVASQIATMRPHALLVNNSRGGILDEAALLAALHSGTIAGAALDVFEQEPVPSDSPLLSAPNLILSSHTAGYSDSALALVTRRCAESLITLLNAAPQQLRAAADSQR